MGKGTRNDKVMDGFVKMLTEYEKALAEEQEKMNIASINVNRIHGAIIAMKRLIDERKAKPGTRTGC